MPTITLTATPAFALSFAGAGTILGGASSNGADPLKPDRIKVAGYERGSMQGLTPVLAKEFEKLQRAQPNSDTVEINADYALGPFDRTIDVDTGRGDVTIVLKPATTRYAQSITIVKTSTDFNNVRVLAAKGNQLGDAAGLAWTDPFVAYTMRPDGDTHWWIEGVHDEAVKIAPGAYSKVVVDGKGRVRYGYTTLGEGDVTLTDVTINDVTIDRHGLVPKLSGVASQYFDGTGNWTVPSGMLGVRAAATVTTASLADGSIENAAISVAKGAVLYGITVTRAARVILYSSATARAADIGRLLGVSATPGTGTLAEFSFAAAGSIECGPLPLLRNADMAPVASIYSAITNQSGSTGTVRVDLEYVPIES